MKEWEPSGDECSMGIWMKTDIRNQYLYVSVQIFKLYHYISDLKCFYIIV